MTFAFHFASNLAVSRVKVLSDFIVGWVGWVGVECQWSILIGMVLVRGRRKNLESALSKEKGADNKQATLCSTVLLMGFIVKVQFDSFQLVNGCT